MTTAEFEAAVKLADWIWPLLADHPMVVQRLALVKLSAMWLEGEPHAIGRKILLDGYIAGIEGRMAGKVGDDV